MPPKPYNIADGIRADMLIRQLRTENFRHLVTRKALDFHPQLNLISGDNGSGKTALLEAVYILGRGRSFREQAVRHIIRHKNEHFRLIAQLEHEARPHLLGIERRTKDYRLRFDGESLDSLGDLARLLPVQIINADHFSLIGAGPEYRRQFMNYGLFYDTPNFLPAWRRYRYALRNRNAALRENWPNEHLHPWHPLLEQSAVAIDTMRGAYLSRLEERLNHYHNELGGLAKLTIRYHRGWPLESTLCEQLDKHLLRDRQLKHTREGIHRAEWRILADDRDISHTYSRGQQKTVVCALMLAQSHEIGKATGKHPLMLVDDLVAELDTNRQKLLMEFLLDSGSQLFITGTLPYPRENRPQACCFQLDNGRVLPQ